MLVIIVVSYFLIIAIPASVIGGPVRVAMLGLLLVVAVRTRRRSGRWLRPAVTLAVLLVTATIIAANEGSEAALSAISSAAAAILVVVVIILITKSLMASGVVDGTAVRAVLCIYLLLALLFAALNQCLGVFFDPYLSGASHPPTASQALYFSVVTLATIGYGDIVPVNDLARALVVAEALIGQLYLVSIVAAVVGQYGSKGPSKGPD
jgi:hypothetical protein